jgi:hypothetical protein
MDHFQVSVAARCAKTPAPQGTVGLPLRFVQGEWLTPIAALPRNSGMLFGQVENIRGRDSALSGTLTTAPLGLSTTGDRG